MHVAVYTTSDYQTFRPSNLRIIDPQPWKSPQKLTTKTNPQHVKML